MLKVLGGSLGSGEKFLERDASWAEEGAIRVLILCVAALLPCWMIQRTTVITLPTPLPFVGWRWPHVASSHSKCFLPLHFPFTSALSALPGLRGCDPSHFAS